MREMRGVRVKSCNLIIEHEYRKNRLTIDEEKAKRKDIVSISIQKVYIFFLTFYTKNIECPSTLHLKNIDCLHLELVNILLACLKEVLSFCNVNGKTFWLVTVSICIIPPSSL